MADGKVVIIVENGPQSYARGHMPTAIDFSGAKKKSHQEFSPKIKTSSLSLIRGGPGCRAFKRGADAPAKFGLTNTGYLPSGISGWERSGSAIS